MVLRNVIDMKSNKSSRFDMLGDRLKTFERIETDQKFPPNSYLYVRLDGRSFSKFTKGLKRPYDQRLSNLMATVTKALVKQFNALIGYTQSDEISLIINHTYESGCIFEGKKQKLLSTLSAYASSVFAANLAKEIPEKDPLVTDVYPSFDCRIFPVFTKSEAANALLWRENDAIKNSVSMAAYDNFSTKELFKVNVKVMKDMLKTQKNIIWDDYPKFFKSGSYFQRGLYEKVLEDKSTVTRSKISEVNITLSEISHIRRIETIFGEELVNT